MRTLLIDNAAGEPEVILIGPGGSYAGPPGGIIWDNQKDGPFPADLRAPGKWGGWAKQGNALVVNPGKLAAYQARRNAENQAKADKIAKANTQKAAIRLAKNANTLPELKAVVVALVEYLGLDV